MTCPSPLERLRGCAQAILKRTEAGHRVVPHLCLTAQNPAGTIDGEASEPSVHVLDMLRVEPMLGTDRLPVVEARNVRTESSGA